MDKLHTTMTHLTVVLGTMFLVFLILDQFNPMMNFVNNTVSRWLLAGLCLSGIVQSISAWGKAKKEE